MERELKRPMLADRLPDVSVAESISYDERQPVLKRGTRIKRVKKPLISCIVFLFLIYRILFQAKQVSCLEDFSHTITEHLNYLSNQSETFYKIISIISQEAIEIQLLLLGVISIVRMKNLKIHMFVSLFYGIRAIFLNIQKLPYPHGMISYQPGFPCFSVPYGITRDFYYSGHTGIMMFCVLFWGDLKSYKMKIFSIISMAIVVMGLVVTRVHFTIDIIGGAIFALWLYRYALKQVKIFDLAFTYLYHAVTNGYQWIKMHFH